MKSIYVSAILMAVFSGCASSSGIVSTGPDNYMISRTGGSIADGTGSLETDALKEGNEYCSKNGKILKLQRVEKQGPGLMREAHVEVYFDCMKATSTMNKVETNADERVAVLDETITSLSFWL